jgi:GTPase
MSLPVLALVGRPNVGKSTLFNRLTRSRDALVAAVAGLTRDRQYGYGRFEPWRFIVVDTGGLMPAIGDPVAALAESQARLAIQDADKVLFLVDAQAGVTGSDRDIADYLRRSAKPVQLVVNKIDGLSANAAAEFHELGLGAPMAIAAEHGSGVEELLTAVLRDLPQPSQDEDDAAAAQSDARVYVAVVGRPNVGKSTLVNRLLGEERVLAADQPGTTRDAIQVPFSYEGQDYVLIDTAGVRRRARVHETVEKFSIVKTLQAIDRAQVVIVVVDAQQDIGEQDARLIGLVASRGRGMVIAVNKWDGLEQDQRRQVRDEVDLKLPFLDFVPLHYVSGRHGSGVGKLMRDACRVYQAATRDLSTPELNRVLERAVDRHAPPAVTGRRIKLRYAHQGGKNPLKIVIHGNQTARLPAAYKRFLANEFRTAFDLRGVPLALFFKTGDNPYADRRNELTPRQVKKRRRLIDRGKR